MIHSTFGFKDSSTYEHDGTRPAYGLRRNGLRPVKVVINATNDHVFDDKAVGELKEFLYKFAIPCLDAQEHEVIIAPAIADVLDNVNEYMKIG